MKRAVGVLAALCIAVFGMVYRGDGGREDMTAAVDGYLAAVAAESPGQLAHRENLALWYNHCLASEQMPVGVESGDLLSYSGMIAVVNFPESETQFPVYREDAAEELPGLWHREGTALPIGGQKTPAILEVRGTVHPQLPAIGSSFTVQVLSSTLTYRVVAYSRTSDFPQGDVCVILYPVDGGYVAVVGIREYPQDALFR